MHVAELDLSLLDDAPRNANRMPEAKYRALVDSIRRIGFVQPLLVRDTGDGRFEIVDGHHRRNALREIADDALDGSPKAMSVVLTGGEDPRLVALAMNRLRGDVDLATASIVIDELVDEGISMEDLGISGFTQQELQDLIDALNTPEPSLDDLHGTDVPDPVNAPVARPFLLELTFKSKQDLAAAKKALKTAAGKGGDLADGLLRLAGSK